MKKNILIKNPQIFQGEKYLNTNKTYFEGWYFKITNKNNSISFIPGISINKKEKHSFIQIITNNTSYYIKYNIKEFKYSHTPFYIKIAESYFSKEYINIDIEANDQKLKLKGNLKFSNNININTNILNPNIMGPFSYIPFMECNHAILSMKNNINGTININSEKLIFNNSTGYIEKDWGTSFPSSYIWCQGNKFKNQNVSFMLSIATIPFKLLEFLGIICSLIINNDEYRFATYNNTKLIKYQIDNNHLKIILKKRKYYLYLDINYNQGQKLIAPNKGKMSKEIIETLSSSITITLKKNNKIIFKDTSHHCGLEIVK